MKSLGIIGFGSFSRPTFLFKKENLVAPKENDLARE